MNEETKTPEAVAGSADVSEEAFVAPTNPVTGEVLTNPKTGKPFTSNKEIMEFQIEHQVKLDHIRQDLDGLFPSHCILITRNGIIHTSKDSINDLAAMCKHAAKFLDERSEQFFAQNGFFGADAQRVALIRAGAQPPKGPQPKLKVAPLPENSNPVESN
jgi:hypothetical protein